MYQRSIELAVGVFMILGFTAIVFLALKVSGLTLNDKEDTYKLYAQFTDLGGLSVRGEVALSGVTIGRVSDITLDDNYFALVEMEIYSHIDKIPEDSAVSIQTAGLLGEKYISVSLGGDFESFLAEGGTFLDTQPALNLEKIISSFASGQSEF